MQVLILALTFRFSKDTLNVSENLVLIYKTMYPVFFPLHMICESNVYVHKTFIFTDLCVAQMHGCRKQSQPQEGVDE